MVCVPSIAPQTTVSPEPQMRRLRDQDRNPVDLPFLLLRLTHTVRTLLTAPVCFNLVLARPTRDHPPIIAGRIGTGAMSVWASEPAWRSPHDC